MLINSKHLGKTQSSLPTIYIKAYLGS